MITVNVVKIPQGFDFYWKSLLGEGALGYEANGIWDISSLVSIPKPRWDDIVPELKIALEQEDEFIGKYVYYKIQSKFRTSKRSKSFQLGLHSYYIAVQIWGNKDRIPEMKDKLNVLIQEREKEELISDNFDVSCLEPIDGEVIWCNDTLGEFFMHYNHRWTSIYDITGQTFEHSIDRVTDFRAVDLVTSEYLSKNVKVGTKLKLEGLFQIHVPNSLTLSKGFHKESAEYSGWGLHYKAWQIHLI